MVELDKDKKVGLVKKGGFLTRQSAPEVFDMNASIYVWKTNILREKPGLFLENTKIYVMPRERSIDIDDGLDFKIAEIILKEGI